MALYLICVLALLGLVSGDDSCPTPAELSPCTCDGEGLNCMGARSVDEIKKAFRAKFKYGGVRSVWIQGTPITDLPAGLFSNVKSQQFYIEVNSITTVDLKAFTASYKTLNTLSLFGNQIKDFDFTGLQKFERLGTLNLGKNQIETLPANAFNSKSLYSIILMQNRISHIGQNAISKLPNLGKLMLSYNQLTTLGPMSLASSSHATGLQISLAYNRISNVSESAFTGLNPGGVDLSQNKMTSLKRDTFEKLILNMANSGNGKIRLQGNPFSCKGCDFSWLVTNKDLLYNRLDGFACPDGRGMYDLTSSYIGCY